MLFRSSKGHQFFHLLKSATENVAETARMVSELCAQPSRFAELGPVVKDLESKGDQYTADLFELIHKTYVTPLESEDLAALARAIDSAVDSMEAAAARTGIYQVQDSDEHLRAFGDVLMAQAAELVEAVDLLSRKRLHEVHQRVLQVRTLENRADQIFRDALSALYEQARHDPVRFVTMKEIYEALEDATDLAKSVGTTLDAVVMKQS
ncbi:MAG: DUF47 domain-containing protein [Bacillota bacterium]